MSKTTQGSFDMKYHHIDAPTKANEELFQQKKIRKLRVPNKDGAFYREKEYYTLAYTFWHYKRKLDGENIRVYWNGEQALWNGKSNNFQCNAEFSEYMNSTFIEEIFEEKFGRDASVYLFGEHMGPKVQGNELSLENHEFVLYDVNINGTWLSAEQIVEIATYFNIRTCYDFMDGEIRNFVGSLPQLIERVHDGEFKDWEGIVATPLIELRNQKNQRIITKIKNKDYLV